MARIKGQLYSKIERKNMILKSALITFCRMGYDGTNIEDIAKDVGCSHGLVYYYFKNKHEIFLELNKLVVENGNCFLKFFYMREGVSAKDRLIEICDNILDVIKTDENIFYYFHFTTMLRLLKTDVESLNITLPKYIPSDGLREIFQIGIVEGDFLPGDVDMYVNYFMSLIAGFTIRRSLLDVEKINKFILPDSEFIVKQFLKG